MKKLFYSLKPSRKFRNSDVFIYRLFLVFYVLLVIFLLFIVANEAYADCIHNKTCIKYARFDKIVYVSIDVPIDHPFDERWGHIEIKDGTKWVELCYLENGEMYCKYYPLENYKPVVKALQKSGFKQLTINDIDKMHRSFIEVLKNHHNIRNK